MKRCAGTICFAVLCVSAVLAQQKKSVPPPPKPSDEGPSLEVTMKFIQDKLNDVGTLNYVIYVHDNVAGNDWALRKKIGTTNVVANPDACRISFHWKNEKEGTVAQGPDIWFSFKTIGDILVVPIDQDLKAIDTREGHPEWSYKVDPPLFVLKARRTDIKGSNDFDFADEEMANRVAKAMVHAVELCGGGAKPEPF